MFNFLNDDHFPLVMCLHPYGPKKQFSKLHKYYIYAAAKVKAC